MKDKDIDYVILIPNNFTNFNNITWTQIYPKPKYTLNPNNIVDSIICFNYKIENNISIFTQKDVRSDFPTQLFVTEELMFKLCYNFYYKDDKDDKDDKNVTSTDDDIFAYTKINNIYDELNNHNTKFNPHQKIKFPSTDREKKPLLLNVKNIAKKLYLRVNNDIDKQINNIMSKIFQKSKNIKPCHAITSYIYFEYEYDIDIYITTTHNMYQKNIPENIRIQNDILEKLFLSITYIKTIRDDINKFKNENDVYIQNYIEENYEDIWYYVITYLNFDLVKNKTCLKNILDLLNLLNEIQSDKIQTSIPFKKFIIWNFKDILSNILVKNEVITNDDYEFKNEFLKIFSDFLKNNTKNNTKNIENIFKFKFDWENNLITHYILKLYIIISEKKVPEDISEIKKENLENKIQQCKHLRYEQNKILENMKKLIDNNDKKNLKNLKQMSDTIEDKIDAGWKTIRLIQDIHTNLEGCYGKNLDYQESFENFLKFINDSILKLVVLLHILLIYNTDSSKKQAKILLNNLTSKNLNNLNSKDLLQQIKVLLQIKDLSQSSSINYDYYYDYDYDYEYKKNDEKKYEEYVKKLSVKLKTLEKQIITYTQTLYRTLNNDYFCALILKHLYSQLNDKKKYVQQYLNIYQFFNKVLYGQKEYGEKEYGEKEYNQNDMIAYIKSLLYKPINDLFNQSSDHNKKPLLKRM